MATFKEALTTSLTNFAKSIAKTYLKTANIVDNLLSTDSTLPLSAKQGNVLQTQIDTLNSNTAKFYSGTDCVLKNIAESFGAKSGIVGLIIARGWNRTKASTASCMIVCRYIYGNLDDTGASCDIVHDSMNSTISVDDTDGKFVVTPADSAYVITTYYFLPMTLV